MSYIMHDGTPIKADYIVDMGLNGILLAKGDRVLKVPKVCAAPSSEQQHIDAINRATIDNEKAVYGRVWPHYGLVGGYESEQGGFALEFLPRGNLHAFISNQPKPNLSQIDKWFFELASTILHFHKLKVLLYDIAARNILIGNDGSLKFIDFGQSAIFPENQDMTTASEDGCTVQSDIFHFGCLIYSIATWKIFEFDLAGQDFVLPERCQLPLLDGVHRGGLIEKCWTGQYRGMEDVTKDLEGIA